jgi:KDO2-lipid IV(A) lauroyltransferase
MGPIALLILKLSAWVVYWVPPFVREGLIQALAKSLKAARFRRTVIDQNLELGFPGDQKAQERARLAIAAYDHLARLVFEILLLFGPMRKFVSANSRLVGLQNWKDASAHGRGVLFLSSHVGNWEVMAATGAIQGGMNLKLVTKHLKPEWFHRAIERGRALCGVSGTYEPRTLRDVLRHLKSGGTVGFVQDQYAGPPVGVRVPFFGVPVGTVSAVAIVAKRAGAVVLPVVNYRDSDGRFTIDIRKPLEWEAHDDADYEAARNTALYSEEIERHVRAYPEQWLWTHRRFKGDLSPLKKDEWVSGRSRS